MAYSYQTKKYWYCSGTTTKSIGVTMGVNICPSTHTDYSDAFCTYETRKKTGAYQYTFSLSAAATEVIDVRYDVTWSQTEDYGIPSTGVTTYHCYIPVGLTYYTLEQGISKSFTDAASGISYLNYPPLYCQEERWCTFSPAIPT